MSYDITITIEPAPGRFITELDLGNMTSNVAPMWRLASPSLDGLAGIDGQRARDVAEPLLRGLCTMFQQRRQLETLAPSNGWGNFAAAFRYYAQITHMAQGHPEATFHVDK